MIAELLLFISQLKNEDKRAIKLAAISMNTFSELLACFLLITSLLLINKEIAKRFSDVVDMRSLTILCVSYCLFVVAKISQGIKNL